MKKLQGTHIHLVSKLDGEEYRIAFARSASVTMNRKMIQISSSASGDSEEYIPGRKGWSMSIETLLSGDESTVMMPYNNGAKLDVEWRDETPDWSETKKNAFVGKAYIKSLKATGNIHDMASFSAELQGTGNLDYTEWQGKEVNCQINAAIRAVKINLDSPSPCDIHVYYNNIFVAAINKGEQSASAAFTKTELYDRNLWTLKQSIANYTFMIQTN